MVIIFVNCRQGYSHKPHKTYPKIAGCLGGGRQNLFQKIKVTALGQAPAWYNVQMREKSFEQPEQGEAMTLWLRSEEIKGQIEALIEHQRDELLRSYSAEDLLSAEAFLRGENDGIEGRDVATRLFMDASSPEPSRNPTKPYPLAKKSSKKPAAD